MKLTRPLISFDWALKKLLRNKANFVILEGFLSVLLKRSITIIQILESEANSDDDFQKINRVDLLVENQEKERIIIELQYSREFDYFHRILFATSKHILENFEKGDTYQNIKKVYSINLLYFDLGQGADYVYHGKTEFVGLHKNDILGLSTPQKELFSKESVYEIYPEYYVIKINSFDDIAKDSLDEWIYYFKNNEVKEEFKAQGLSQVREYLQIEGMNEQEQHSYERFLELLSTEKGILQTARIEGLKEGKIEGKIEGLKEGEDIGIKRTKKQVIKKALERGKLSIEEIAEDFEVTIEFVLSIKESL